MTDVNESFYQERQDLLNPEQALARRLESGEITEVRPGVYRQTTGWDSYEEFTANKGVLVPQHGLDMSTGQAALAYRTGVPIWHELGNAIPEGMNDIDKVLDLGGVSFRVEKKPLFIQDAEVYSVVPDHFATVRDDTNASLGVVGNKYTPFQNREAMEFLQDLTGNFDLTWESVGATRNGRRVFVCVKLPESVVIDPEGIKDQIDLYISVINSHDGSSPLMAVVSPWRPICGNTERFAVRDAVYKWTTRHTINAKHRLDEARRTLGLTLKYKAAFEAEEEKLAQNELLMDEFRDIMLNVFPREEDESKSAITQRDNRETALEELWGKNKNRLGGTSYAAERAFTEYFDNVAPRKLRGDTLAAARATAIIEGMDDGKKTQVHKLLMQRVK